MLRAVLIVSCLAGAAPLARAGAPVARELTGKAIPAGVKTLATVEKALGWTDASGDVVAIFSRNDTYDDDIKSSYLQVDLVVIDHGKPRILRTVKDLVEQCGEDITLELVPAATSVTDLDGDGHAELTFAYRMSCKGDISPDDLKLLVLEDKDKYILRGTDVFTPDPDAPTRRQGGTFTPEPPAAKWPAPFLDHAKATWKAILHK